ncbi:MAG: membrane dipeptidase, partial [Bacteroidales bacterium]|nr:membrane dipeptidase [Bacteroidales bacterium]
MRNIVFYFIILVLFSGCKGEEERLLKKAEGLHKSLLTVDTHCDTPMYFEDPDFDLGVRQDEVCVDFPRMKEGGLDAEFFAVFISQGPRNDSAYAVVHNKALGIFNDIRDNVSKNSSMAGLALSPDDAIKLEKEGRIAAFIGLENGYPAGKNLGRIQEYYDLGARYITLCHSTNNDICDSSNDPNGPEHNGLSAFGRDLVKEMNRIGMIIDVSHISDKSFYDVISLSEAPVIASHSSCRALCSSPRNMTDDMLLSLKDNGGVIQICILSSYIKTP